LRVPPLLPYVDVSIVSVKSSYNELIVRRHKFLTAVAMPITVL